MSAGDTAAARVLPRRSEFARLWRHDPAVVFLNHGSFGSVPAQVLARQQALRDQFQLEPVRFVVEELEPLLDESRRAAAGFVGCAPDDLVFVLNATMGVNTVVRSLEFKAGDEILTNDHEYNACQNVLRWAQERWGVKVVVAEVPFPIASSDEVYRRIVAAATERTRLVLVSHVTSPTGLIFPVDQIVAEMNRRGVDTIVDGAHAPGMQALNVEKIGAPYYTGNFHKWTCSPPGSAMLYVRRDKQAGIRPTVISHGANSRRTDRSRFHLEFDNIGTMDWSAWVCVGDAIRVMGSMLPGGPGWGGWDEVRRRNHELALAGRKLLNEMLGAEAAQPEEMIGSLATVRLPDRREAEDGQATKYHDPLQDRLIARHSIQVPIIPFKGSLGEGGARTRYVRISAQLYNTIEQYEYLGRAIRAETGE